MIYWVRLILLLLSFIIRLELSKMEAGKMTLEQRPFSIAEVVKESLEVVSFDASHKGLELTSEIDNLLPNTVTGDPCRLRQVLINLLNNAIKFSFTGPVIVRTTVLATTDTSCRILFSVEDHGIGIPEKDQTSLFQPFTQADTATTRKFVSSFQLFHLIISGWNWTWSFHFEKTYW